MLGHDLNQDQFDIFLNTPQVKACMPIGWQAGELNCHCSPRINLTGAIHPYAERMVFLGDSGVSRLYKDGIGAAYRAAKAASTAVIFSGISEADLAQSYGRVSRAMERDNVAGKLIFKAVDLLKGRRVFGWAMLRAIEWEQKRPANQRPLSDIVWDLFTGSAPYEEVFIRLLNPAVWGRSILFLAVALIRRR
jgi:hypothetical protein